jgi:CBS domain-containing protein
MKVKEIMTANPTCATPRTNLKDIAKLMLDKNCGAIPIVENFQTMRPVGVVTDRDITTRTVARGINPILLTAETAMTTPVKTLKPESTIEECCELMEAIDVRRVPIVDEDGKLCGIVAQADIARNAPAYETAELVKDVSMAAQM